MSIMPRMLFINYLKEVGTLKDHLTLKNIDVLANLKHSTLLEKNPVLIRRLSLIQYLMMYLACISLVFALWELLSVFTHYLEPSCLCFSARV